MNRKDEDSTDFSDTNADDLIEGQSKASEGPRADEEVTEIRHSIEQTRSDMGETIDELQERLSPSRLKEQVKEQVMEQYRQARDSVREATIGKVEDMVERVSDTMHETRRSMVATVTANPIPSAMIGIGLAWLWMNRRTNFRNGGNYRYSRRYDESGSRHSGGRTSRNMTMGDESWDRYADSSSDRTGNAGHALRDAAAQVQDTASDLATKAKNTVSGVVDQAQQTASDVIDHAQHQARRVEQGFNAAMERSPLAIGAVALALGTAVGLSFPTTRKENEWMGEARDTVVGRAQAAASEAIDKVQEVASKVTDQMASASAERQGVQQSGGA